MRPLSRLLRLRASVPALALLVLLLLPRAGAAQVIEEIGDGIFPPGAWLSERFTTTDGLPQNTIAEMTFDRRGYLWLATFGGLARFDGVRFQTFEVATSEGMRTNRLTSVFADRDDRIWVGYESVGIGLLEPDGSFRTFGTDDLEGDAPGPLSATWDIAQAPDGTIWAATGDGLLHGTAEDGFEFTPLPEGRLGSARLLQVGDTLLLGSNQGVHRIVDGRVERNPLQPRAGAGAIRSMFLDASGEVWLVGTARTIRLGYPELPIPASTTSDQAPWGLAQGPGGITFVLGPRSYALPDAELRTGFPRVLEERLPLYREDYGILSVGLTDNEGTAWIGTRGLGLIKLRRRAIRRYDAASGVPEDGLRAVVAHRGGAVAGTCSGLTFYDSDTRQFSTTAEFDGRRVVGCVNTLASAPDSSLWFASNGWIHRLGPSGEFERFDWRSEIDLWPGALLLEADGTWFVGRDGLIRAEGDSLVRHPVPWDDWPAQGSSALLRGGDGSVWWAGNHGVIRFEDSLYTRWPAEGTSRAPIRALHEDERGVLWVGTYGDGLYRLEDGRTTGHFTREEGLFDNVVSAIVPDDDGILWMNGNRGVFGVRRDALDAYAADSTASIFSIGFTTKDGTVEGSGGNQPAGTRLDDGRIWFVTLDGIAEVFPARRARNEVPPTVVIEDVAVGEESFGTDTPLIPPGTTNLEIRYTALSMARPEWVQFEYRLVEESPVWTNAGNRRTAFFSRLSPGTYTFEVRASNDEGVWSPEPARLQIRMAPAIWQTLWFRVLAVLTLGAGLIGALKWRVADVERHNRELQEEMDEREKVQSRLGVTQFSVDSALDSVYWLSKDGRYVYLNDAACERLGYTRDELIGQPASLISPRMADPESWSETLSTIRAQSGVELVSQHRHKDGSLIDVEIRARMAELDGEEHIFAFARDISDRLAAEREQARLIGELEDKNAELERFTYTVSHDLKAPLVTIKGFLGLLRQDTAAGDQERMEADVREIGDAADKMQRLLDELLELSRVGRLINPSEEIDLNELFGEVTRLVRGRLDEGGVEVVIAPGMGSVYGDRTRLTEVAQNLLDNAAKFMGDQPEPRIEIGTEVRGSERLIFVRDNGLGIAPDYHETVFSLFDRLDPEAEGTGIGLALVRRIVETHGGRIWVESGGPGTGATFYFSIPDADVRTDEAHPMMDIPSK